ncbi:biopolymer transporter ExbD [Burkholderia pseudomultivorans]|uniref:Biopolymer transport ExbD/TolR family protein n=2 Tax=Burkholderia cepacia complex TaxID=87882 RepID=A0AAN0VJW8_9BURK|nr:biopolymer transporter ExbD [Burkholderia pseudomultivorans]AIO30214.1 biopolymer transport ExbD/TolR family protein [Burkholderia cenocepacia]EGC98496.1 protein TolR [Burkholderia sp. TJI49]AOI90730.1 protein TolR [Burkholderia pseudomultivorans]KVC24981.1 protein TolR [Burkholderia pseudomultivorans]KVC34800.1 protein TolR [Burkholderia pseudomultivorans]
MGAKLSGPRGPGASFGAPVSEINVTPLVDVMLVLLIVFMIAAPLMASGVKVDLPTSNARPLNEEKPPIAVSIDRRGQVFVDKSAVAAGQLRAALASATGGDRERRVFLRGDQALPYGTVIATMGEISDAGYAKVALVSEPPKQR